MEIFLGIYILGVIISFIKVANCGRRAKGDVKLIVVLMSWLGVLLFNC